MVYNYDGSGSRYPAERDVNSFVGKIEAFQMNSQD
jgi:hypothetical protein